MQQDEGRLGRCVFPWGELAANHWACPSRKKCLLQREGESTLGLLALSRGEQWEVCSAAASPGTRL